MSPMFSSDRGAARPAGLCPASQQREPLPALPEPGNQQHAAPRNGSAAPDSADPRRRDEGTMSDPDFQRPAAFLPEAAPVKAGLLVQEVMTRYVAVVHPDSTLEAAAVQMTRRGVGPLPVCDGGRLVGLITDRDIVERSVARGEDTARDRVRDVMTREVFACFEDQGVAEAARLMREKGVDQLPVLSRANRLVGIVSRGDLAGRSEEV